MSVIAVVLLVLVALVAALFVAGLVVNGRRRAAQETALRARIAAANDALAAAHAEDKGWAPDVVEAAARDAFAARHGGAPAEELHLVQVVDLPGTDADQAVFRAVVHGREEELVLGRRDGAWVAVQA